MPKTRFKNFAVSTLLNAITRSAASLQCQSGDASKFFAIGAGEIMWITLEDEDGNREIMKCTARASNTFTVSRGQQGTEARAWAAGVLIEGRLTASDLDTIPQGLEVETKSWTPGAIASGAELGVDVPVTEAELGDFVIASASVDLQGMKPSCYIKSANNAHYILRNDTGAPITLGTFTIYVRVIKK